MPGKTHRLAAIVFTDIVGYTKRMEENEQKTMELLEKQREIIYPLAKTYGGEVIKEIGDGLMMMFDSAVQAVRFAITVQTRLKDDELTIRAGIHIGDIIFEDGDVFGSAVNTAARIEPLASPNGICISENVRAQLHNKTDIITISLGKKELKGVKEPIEIFEVFIEGVSEKRAVTPGFILRDLWNRNVIQLLAGYLAASWVLKQAVAAIVGRYLLSPYLVDLAWVLLLSFLPTVALLAYFHGKRSSGRWTRVERIGLPANVVLAGILVFLLFKGKDLGATTEQVTVEDERGQTIVRNVARSEFRKDIVIFFFENRSGDPTLDWLQYGLPSLLQYDLSQDLFIDASEGLSYVGKFRDAGYSDGLNAPLMLKKKIADDYHRDYFVTGNFSGGPGSWEIVMEVFNTEKGEKLAEVPLDGADLFALADLATRELKKAIGMPAQQVEQSTDLPVAEIFTANQEAFEEYMKAETELSLNNDFATGIEHLEKAVSLDNDFALAHLSLAMFYFNSNLLDKAGKSLKVAMDKDFKLTERNRYFAKHFYYLIRQEPEQAMSVLKMCSELYPADINVRIQLAERYILRNDFDGAIAQYHRIIGLAPGDHEYINALGDIYERTGQYDSSIYYYRLYAKYNPDDFSSYKNLGDTYLLKADFGQATENFNKALLLDPDNTSALLKLSMIASRQGDTDMARDMLLEALPNCKTPQDSLNIFIGLEEICVREGRILRAFDHYQEKFRIYERIVPPLRLMVLRTFMIDRYVEVKREKEALDLLRKMESEFQAPIDKVAAFGYLFYYIACEQPEKAAEYIDDAIELMNGFGEQTLIANIYYAEGKIAEQTGNHDTAIVRYKSFQSLFPSDISTYRRLARCSMMTGDIKEAKAQISIALKHDPSNPKNLYEAARIYHKDGDAVKASEYLDRANEIWKNADAIYEPAAKARRESAEFSGT